MKPSDVIQLSNQMFEQQFVACSLWQTLAENFAPHLADFTARRSIGDEMADGLVDSYPVLMCRDLSNGIGSMLRDGPDWFELGSTEDHVGYDSKLWLQNATRAMRTEFESVSSGFRRATKEADQFYTLTGQGCVSVEPRRDFGGLMFRSWHMRDVAFRDGENGQIGIVARNWCPTVTDLQATFGPEALTQTQRDLLRDKPLSEVKVRHVVMPVEMFGDDEFEGFKFVSLFIDLKEERFIERKPLNHPYYVIPRWQTIAGQPYAISPASISALPNARTLQAMTFTLLEAAERHARPPMVANQQAVRSDIALEPDSVTFVDADYDERFGQAIRPLYTGGAGTYPVGQDMRLQFVEIMASCFYANRLQLPDTGHEMTAYEVQERMKQFRRENLPLFMPIEKDYNGQLCEVAFQTMLDMNMLGSKFDIPEELQGTDARFIFKSPLSELDDERRVFQMRQAAELLQLASVADEGVRHDFNAREAFRSSVAAIDAPMPWLRPPEEVVDLDQAEVLAAAAQAQVAA